MCIIATEKKTYAPGVLGGTVLHAYSGIVKTRLLLVLGLGSYQLAWLSYA